MLHIMLSAINIGANCYAHYNKIMKYTEIFSIAKLKVRNTAKWTITYIVNSITTGCHIQQVYSELWWMYLRKILKLHSEMFVRLYSGISPLTTHKYPPVLRVDQAGDFAHFYSIARTLIILSFQ